MFCEKCGKSIADNVAFCDGCGAPVEKAEAPSYSAPIPGGIPVPGGVPVVNVTPPTVEVVHKEKRRPASVAGFIFRPLIAAIPIAGPIIYFIMLFVWANDKTAEETFNNWAKAQLWMILIGVVLAVITCVIMFSLGASLGGGYNW